MTALGVDRRKSVFPGIFPHDVAGFLLSPTPALDELRKLRQLQPPVLLVPIRDEELQAGGWPAASLLDAVVWRVAYFAPLGTEASVIEDFARWRMTADPEGVLAAFAVGDTLAAEAVLVAEFSSPAAPRP